MDEDGRWTELIQNRVEWWDVMLMVLNFRNLLQDLVTLTD